MTMTDKQTDEKPNRDARGYFLPGPGSAGPGRPKGSRNGTTMTLKTALMESFWQLGGPAYFVKLAQSNPEVYARLLLQILPRAMPEGGEDDGDGDIFDDPDPDL